MKVPLVGAVIIVGSTLTVAPIVFNGEQTLHPLILYALALTWTKSPYCSPNDPVLNTLIGITQDRLLIMSELEPSQLVKS